MRNIILTLALLCFLLSTGKAQNDNIAKNSVYFEIGGLGGFYSFNYDRILFKTNNFTFSGRVGMAPLISTNVNDKIYWDFFPRIPIALNAMTGKKNHHFKFGLAYTPYYYNESKYSDMNVIQPCIVTPPVKQWNHLFSLVIGYRFQKAENGMYLSVDVIPVNYKKGITFSPWAGIGIGYSF